MLNNTASKSMPPKKTWNIEEFMGSMEDLKEKNRKSGQEIMSIAR